MKKVFLILGMLLTLGMFCACSSGDEADSSPLERGDHTSRSEEKTDSTKLEEDSMEIKMVSMDGGVYAFFKEKLWNNYNHDSRDSFSIGEDMCYRIDSKEEFVAIYTGTDELPEIDFSKYTLLLGSKGYDNPDTDVDNCKQVLTESEDGYNLNLYSRHRDGEWTSLCINLQIFYYGLYPKLEDKEITVNLIYE